MTELTKLLKEKLAFDERKLKLQFVEGQFDFELACAESGAVRENSRLTPTLDILCDVVEALEYYAKTKKHLVAQGALDRLRKHLAESEGLKPDKGAS